MAAFAFFKDIMIELLSPAGDMDCLIAAIESGADAVYCGGKSFSARSYAGNFDSEEMERAAAYCHLRGKKIYVALNTMILEREMDEAFASATLLSYIGVDALIVSDIGLADRIIGNLEIPVHASTQMCVHDAAGAEILKSRGYKRVVPARELSLKEIKDIAETGIETEVFVHGALCSSVSGLCLMSSFIGQRSGNRGCCAQPCRLRYRAGGHEGYLLSTADLCLAEHIDELEAAGAASLKIEGRMKSPDYVAGVTDVYSRLLKGEVTGAQAKEELSRFYNRTFTDGYLEGRTDVCAPDRPDTRVRESSAAETGDKKFVFLSGTAVLKEGKKPELTVSKDDITVTYTGAQPLPRAKAGISDASIVRSLERTGGTPFEFESIKVVREGEPYISKAELNALRRGALEALEFRICAPYYRFSDMKPPQDSRCEEINHEFEMISVQTHDADMAVRAFGMGADRVYFSPYIYDANILKDAEKIYEESGRKPYIRLLPYMNSRGYANLKSVLEGNEGLFAGMLAGHFSQMSVFDGFDDAVIDHTCNIANGASAEVLRSLGAGMITISSELAKRDILHLRSCLRTELIVYGSLPVMWIAHDVYGKSMNDRKGHTYEYKEYVSGDFRVRSIENPDRLCLKEIGRLKDSVDSLRIIAEIEADLKMIDLYRSAAAEGKDLSLETSGTTQGHLLRGV